MAQRPDAPQRTASVPAVIAAAAVSWGQEWCDRAAGCLVPLSSQQAGCWVFFPGYRGSPERPHEPHALCLSCWP